MAAPVVVETETEKERIAVFTSNVINHWITDAEHTICPEHYGLQNHCNGITCRECKLLALQDAGIIQT